MFNDWLKHRTKEEAFKILGDAGVPCSPAYDLKEVANHPYLHERGILQEIQDPRLGTMTVLSPRIRFADEPVITAQYAPQLGEQNDEIFGELLGLTSNDISGPAGEERHLARSTIPVRNRVKGQRWPSNRS